MRYICAEAAAKKWDLKVRRVQDLCSSGRIPGAIKKGRDWRIPNTAPKPEDRRIKSTASESIDWEYIVSDIFKTIPLHSSYRDTVSIQNRLVCSIRNDGTADYRPIDNPSSLCVIDRMLITILAGYAFAELMNTQTAEFYPNVTVDLLMIYNQRFLTEKEKSLAIDMTTLCNHALDTDHAIISLDLIKNALKEAWKRPKWEGYHFLPFKLCILLNKGSREKKIFWDYINDHLKTEREVIHIIDKYDIRRKE